MKIYWHPMFVHFPIAFYFLEMVLLIIWQWKKNRDHLKFARFSLMAGYLFMVAALVSGYVATGGWEGMSEMARRHFFLALALFVFYSVRVAHILKIDSKASGSGRALLAGAVLGNILVAYTAYLGGLLVYS